MRVKAESEKVGLKLNIQKTKIMASSPIQVTKWPSEVAQSCPTLCNPMDCSLPHFSIYGIFQARVPERVAISFSRTMNRKEEFFKNWKHKGSNNILRPQIIQKWSGSQN